MSEIKIIGLDLDDTLFNSKKEITPRTLAAIEAAAKKGIVVLPATGRPITGLPSQFMDIPGVNYALTSNGATVTEISTGKVLVEQPFQREMALGIYRLLEPLDNIINVFTNGVVYTSADTVARSIEICHPSIREYVRRTRHPVEDMEGFLMENIHGIEKFNILYESEEVRQYAWALVAQHYPDAEIASSLPGNIEINAPGVNKGSGLIALAKHLGFTAENVMAIGDSGNDLAMIQQAGLGVAMGNAQPHIKAAAKVITDDNNHDGVAKAIETYALGISE